MHWTHLSVIEAKYWVSWRLRRWRRAMKTALEFVRTITTDLRVQGYLRGACSRLSAERKKNKAATKSEPGETGEGDPNPPRSRPSLPTSLGYFLPFHHLRAWNRLPCAVSRSETWSLTSGSSCFAWTARRRWPSRGHQTHTGTCHAASESRTRRDVGNSEWFWRRIVLNE